MNRKYANPLLMSSVVAALTLGGISGCVIREQQPVPVAVTQAPPPPAPGGDVVVQEAPPPDVVDVQPAQPGPTYVWIGGFWGWNGGRYYWHRGYWNRPPYGYHAWAPDHWVVGPRGRVFVHGHWR